MEEFFQKISSLGIFLDQDLIVGNLIGPTFLDQDLIVGNLLGPTFSTIAVVIG